MLLLFPIQVALAVVGVLVQLMVYAQGRLRLGGREVGGPIASTIGVLLLAPIPLCVGIWLVSWLPAVFGPQPQLHPMYRGGQRGHEGLSFDDLNGPIGWGVTGALALSAGALLVLGTRRDGVVPTLSSGSSASSELYFCGGVGPETPTATREYVLGGVYGQEDQWPELGHDLARALGELNQPRPRVNWNIRVLRDSTAAEEVGADTLQLVEVGNGCFPVVWVKVIYDEAGTDPDEFRPVEKDFDLRPLSEKRRTSRRAVPTRRATTDITEADFPDFA